MSKYSNKNFIYYTGIGSGNQRHFNEKDFRTLIKENMKYYHLYGLDSELNQAVVNPLFCDLSLLLKLTGAIIKKY